ncbi:Mitochondrial ATPase inhibitor, IATP [Carex littledalei]|uniref:Mitochondrial ATPase inhibitor, IATP n=1 Tax=Carex littledalei TaxID=544730 RepID=A0A833QI92_9POAL|nr:Mitochondrial ATPase inhibitor, IATP [Carex littledalei]
MSIRSALVPISRTTRAVGIQMEGAAAFGRSSARAPRYFSDGKGRVLSEEERAKETVYIQKMERERLEKLRKKMEKEKAEAEKANVTNDKKTEEPLKG